MENKLGQEPAFAALAIDKSIKSDEQTTEHYLNGNSGMSKRFYAACAAMQGILASPNTIMTIKNAKEYAEMSFDFADELLKQENE